MIVDASVAVKWLLREPDTDDAVALIGQKSLSAPDLIHAEIANIVWKHTLRGEVHDIEQYLARLDQILDHVSPCWELAASATALAVTLRHPAYDCFYLALAIAEDAELVTADRRFVATCAGTPHEARVRLLA
ncbi:hypothetical protein IP88_07985 [alpha proteobacterium AAP81b]|nr:hypothetical protein IP88_07985 [alpha proteobacterium AAP81b]